MFGDDAMLALLVAAPVALAVAYYDIRYMIIPNWLVLAGLAVFSAFLFVMLPLDAIGTRFISAGIVFVVCIVFFMVGAMGGGDAKMAPVLALMINPVDASVALVLLAVIGLIGVTMMLVLRRVTRMAGGWKEWWEARKSPFPYGAVLGATLLVYLTLASTLAS